MCYDNFLIESVFSVFSYEEQRVVFSQQVKLAKELDLPIVIHSRGSTNNDLTLDVIKEVKDWFV